jgi:hypothetical protein
VFFSNKKQRDIKTAMQKPEKTIATGFFGGINTNKKRAWGSVTPLNG